MDIWTADNKDCYLRLCKPRHKHKTFRIQIQDHTNLKKWKTLRLERLDKINKSYRSGTTSFDGAVDKCKRLIQQLYKERARVRPALVFHNTNNKILQQYWESKYPLRQKRKMAAPEAAYNDLKAAINSCGNIPLDSCSYEELQDAIDEKYEDNPNKQRRIVGRLNSLLKFVDRPFVLDRYDPKRHPVKYLSLNEFKALYPALLYRDSVVFQLLCCLGIYSGLRVGEIFALRKEDVKRDHVSVTEQVTRKRKRTDTKNKKHRKAFTIPEGRHYFEEWFNTSEEERNELRNKKHSELLKTRCAKIWPDRRDKHIYFHCLRHSYAIVLASRGASMTYIAQCLGNSIQVCEQYYVGFMLVDESLENLGRLFEHETKKREP